MSATGAKPANPQAVANVTGGSEGYLTFSLVIKKTDKLLGIDVSYSNAEAWTRNGVFIARVFEDGLVATWNARSREPRKVKPGDFIFQVNDVHGDTVSLIQELKVKQQLTIHVLRRSAPAALLNSAPPAVAETAALPTQPAAPMLVEKEDAEKTLTAHQESSTPLGAGQQELELVPAEALVPQLVKLEDEALAGLIVVALQSRPWLTNAVLGSWWGGPEGGAPPDKPPLEEGEDHDALEEKVVQ